jgi:hypothetical protein
VLLLALLPMFYAMSRYFYVEFPLTAMSGPDDPRFVGRDSFQKRGAALFSASVWGWAC